MVKTYADLYLSARQSLLLRESAQDASLLARQLMCYVTGLPQEQVIAQRDTPAGEAVCEAMDRALARLMLGEPLAYVLGQWDFHGMTLYVDKNVLIPRDDTCAVTDLAIHHGLYLASAPRILDLCTGSGCIGLALANRLRDAKVTLGDISREALAVAKKNIVLQKLSGRVASMLVDALQPPTAFLGRFDMIVSNPPYVTTQQMAELPHSVKDFEPHLALHGGGDGLDFYRSIAENFGAALKHGGLLAFEFGMGQGDGVCAILEESGYSVLERARDYNGIERAVIARYNRKED